MISKHLHDWSNIKKYTNPYEFIHTNIPSHNYPVSKIKPISRAFFKLIEIYNTHNICFDKKQIKTFHLAEGPGGFLEATAFLRKNRKISLVVVLSLSAIITPPDIVSQIIVSIPILILYEVSILISRIVVRNQDKALKNV